MPCHAQHDKRYAKEFGIPEECIETIPTYTHRIHDDIVNDIVIRPPRLPFSYSYDFEPSLLLVFITNEGIKPTTWFHMDSSKLVIT
jgi:hypothetical protein